MCISPLQPPEQGGLVSTVTTKGNGLITRTLHVHLNFALPLVRCKNIGGAIWLSQLLVTPPLPELDCQLQTVITYCCSLSQARAGRTYCLHGIPLLSLVLSILSLVAIMLVNSLVYVLGYFLQRIPGGFTDVVRKSACT